MNKVLVLLSFLLVLCGCSSGSLSKSVTPYSDSGQCVPHENCSLKGVLTIEEIDHVHMGHLVTEDVDCINVSLPSRAVKKFSRKGSEKVIVTGRLFKTPVLSDEDLPLEYKINGRRVGWNQCSDVYLFVDKVSDVKKLDD